MIPLPLPLQYVLPAGVMATSVALALCACVWCESRRVTLEAVGGVNLSKVE